MITSTHLRCSDRDETRKNVMIVCDGDLTKGMIDYVKKSASESFGMRGFYS